MPGRHIACCFTEQLSRLGIVAFCQRHPPLGGGRACRPKHLPVLRQLCLRAQLAGLLPCCDLRLRRLSEQLVRMLKVTGLNLYFRLRH
jgi:hypothetical protein